jgi:hypothetical protein
LDEHETPLDATLLVDLHASMGTTSRWMTGMLQPVEYGDRQAPRGTLRWTSAPAAFSVFGRPVWRCQLDFEGQEAAVHLALEAITRDGKVRYLTEGTARVRPGPVELPLRAIAFELPADASLRLSLAAADADTFEPVTKAATLRVGGPCQLDLPSTK